LLLLTGSESLRAEAAAGLPSLLQAGFQIEVIASKTFRDANGLGGAANSGNVPASMNVMAEFESEAAEESIFGSRTFVVVADVSANTLAKAARGIADSMPSRAIAHFLKRAKPTILLESGPSAILPGPWSRDEHLRTLARGGATLCETSDLPARLEDALGQYGTSVAAPGGVAAASRRAIVTAEDVQEAVRRGEKIFVVPAKAIVTAAARDEAARRGVGIVEGDA